MILKKLLLFSFFACSFSSIIGQTYSSIISDDEIIGFLNWKLGTEKKYSEESKSKFKQLYIGISKWDTASFFPERKKDTTPVSSKYYLFYPQNKWIDTIFSKQDKEFLYKQFNSQIDTIWRYRFTNAKLLKSTKQKKPDRYYLSLPLFSIDKKYVVIRQIYYCGNVCAYGGTRLYRRKGEDSWEYVGSLNSWMS